MKKVTEKGITLIALVITIIVMLILAGTTINIVANGGLFTQAQNAVDETKIKAVDEQAEMVVITAYTDKVANPTKSFEDTVEYAIQKTIFEEKGVIINKAENSIINAIIEDSETGRVYIISNPEYEIVGRGVNNQEGAEEIPVEVPSGGGDKYTVKINAVATTTIRKGKSAIINAKYSENHPAGTTLTWESSNTASIIVKNNADGTGTLTGIKAGGNARITVTTSKGAKYTITVTVTP